ncbi:MAG TPA: PQQ-binding-like beta-propeller repeat protein [Mycobacteriales bacterium]|nr:PQQ-binding-like beta-propeller repeat protein [Mycobacteriales bacterium]
MSTRRLLSLLAGALLLTSCGGSTGTLGGSGAGPAGTTPGLAGRVRATAPGLPPSLAPARHPAPGLTVWGTAAPGTGGPDVTGYHGDAARSGNFPAVPAPTSPRLSWDRRLDGSVYGQPLVIRGTVVVATTNNSVYGLAAAGGAQRWHVSLGTPQQARTLPCGNIGPTVGVTGTPVFDPATGWIYLVAEIAGPHHELFALDPATGAIKFRQLVDPFGSHPLVQQQRSALAVGNGRVYVALGGRFGDCGDYHGYVLATPERGGPNTIYQVPSAREGGIWNASGPALDAAGNVYVAVGNGSATAPADPYDGSDSVLKLSPGLTLIDYYAPRGWAAENAGDVDLGSTGPTLLPNGLVLTLGKSTTLHVLRQTGLGHVGGQVADSTVCAGYGGTAHQANTVFLPCEDGLRAATVDTNGVQVRWRAASAAVTGSPVLGGGAVFALDPGRGVLHVLNEQDGHELATVALPEPTTRFATPALSGAAAFIGTVSGVVAISGV